MDYELKHFGAMLATFTYNFKMLAVLKDGLDNYLSCLYYPHLWSLSLEEQFYIVIIFLAWFANRRMLQIITVAMIIIVPIVRIAGYFWLGGQTSDEHLKTLLLWHLPFFQFDAFFYGIALTVFDFKKSKWYLYLFSASFLVILIFGMYNAYSCAQTDNVSMLVTLREDQYFYRNYGYWFMDSLVNIFCALWFLCVLYFPDKFTLFKNRYIVRFGELTYGLYIFQFLFLPIGMILAQVIHNRLGVPMLLADLVGVSVYIGLNYVFSAFIYERLEMPVVRWKDKYLKKVYAEK